MKYVMIAVMVVAAFSLDASDKIGKVVIGGHAAIVKALKQEMQAYEVVVESAKHVEQQRKQVALLKAFVVKALQMKDLEEHEYIKRFKAQDKIKCLQVEIDKDTQDLRWVKLQNLGQAFGQTKEVFKKNGIPCSDYDRVMAQEYRRVHAAAFKPELQ